MVKINNNSLQKKSQFATKIKKLGRKETIEGYKNNSSRQDKSQFSTTRCNPSQVAERGGALT